MDYYGRKVLETQSGVVVEFNDERWNETIDALEKNESVKDCELIGIRYSPNV